MTTCRVLAAGLLLTCAAADAETLTGRVVEDHTGKPLPSAVVRVSRAGVRNLIAELETNREGRFEAAGVPAGVYQLEVSKPNFIGASLEAQAGADVVARLIRRGVITGRVMNQGAQPVAGVIVAAMPKPAAGGTWRTTDARVYNTSATTDAEGRYRIRNLAPGEYAVVASYGASTRAMGSMGRAGTAAVRGSGFQFYGSNARPALLAVTGGEEHRNIDFTLLTPALFAVSGTVERSDEKAQYWAALVLPEQPGIAVAVTQSAANGAFRFEGIPVGSYRLVAAKFGGGRGPFGAMLAPMPDFAQTSVVVAGQDVTGVVLHPVDGIPVGFALEPAPGCPAGAQLTITALEDWGSNLTKTVALTAGAPSTVPDLAPARYTLAAEGTDSMCFLESSGVLDLTGDVPTRPVPVRIAPAGEIRGRLDAGTRAEAGFAVALVPVEDATAVQVARPDAQARFTFGGLRPGRYRIGAFAAGGRMPEVTKMIEFEVRGGSHVEIDLVAPEEGR